MPTKCMHSCADVFLSITRFIDGEPAQPWWIFSAERKRTLARLATQKK
jgi:hypothetical protein